MNVRNRILTFLHQHTRLLPKPKVATSESATTVPLLRNSRNDSSKTFKETNIAKKAELQASWELFYLIYKLSVALLFIGYALLLISFLRMGVTSLSSSGLICQFMGIIFGSYLFSRACFLNAFLKYKLGAKDFEFSDLASQNDKSSHKDRSTRRKQSVFQFGTNLGAYKAPLVKEVVDTNLNPSASQPSVVREVHTSPVKRSQQDYVESEYNTSSIQPFMEGPISTDLKEQHSFMVSTIDRSPKPDTCRLQVVSEVYASPVKRTRQLNVECETDTISKQTPVEAPSSASYSTQQPLASQVDTSLNPNTGQLRVVCEVHPSPVESTHQPHVISEIDAHSDSRILQRRRLSQIALNPTSSVNQYGITVEQIEGERFFPPNVTIQPDPGCMIYTPYDLIECEKNPKSKCNLQ